MPVIGRDNIEAWNSDETERDLSGDDKEMYFIEEMTAGGQNRCGYPLYLYTQWEESVFPDTLFSLGEPETW